jgi:ankyrin repeat protein
LAALHFAVKNDNVNIARRLLDAGAAINAEASIRNTRNSRLLPSICLLSIFLAALHMAAAYKRLKMIELLLAPGRNATLSQDLEGYTALHLALFVARDDVDVLNKLLALLLPHCNDECLALKTLKGQMTARELAASLNLVSPFEQLTQSRPKSKTEL